jgi:hypothetical protein
MYSHPGYFFKEQHENEKVLKVLHRHWFNVFIQFLVIIFGVAAIFGSWALIVMFYPELSASVGGPQTLAFIETTALIFIWFYAFLIWIDYYLDIWIITDERIVNIEQKGLFLREASDLQLTKIQDVTTNVTGLIPTMMNYGDVYVQTAGEIERFHLRQIPDPYAVKSLIMEKYQNAVTPPSGNL